MATEQKETISKKEKLNSKSKLHLNGNGIEKNFKKTEPVKVSTSIKKKSKKVTIKVSATKTEKTKPVLSTKFNFQVRFNTKYGQKLLIIGNHEIFGNNDVLKAYPMQYLNEEYWIASIDILAGTIPVDGITYNYVLQNEDGSFTYDWGNDKKIMISSTQPEETLIIDSWNHSGYFENAFFTEPFRNVLFKNNFTNPVYKEPATFTHLFKIKAPFISKGQSICLIGSAKETGNWDETKALIMYCKDNADFFEIKINLTKASFPILYKYCIVDLETKKIVRYEDGNNRLLYHAHATAINKITIVNDGFIFLPIGAWKGAGVSIPVFSLRSKNSWGVGEFNDLKLLVDWAKMTGLKLIQILPVNDTTATHTWVDSYPYSAISAFALHPMFIHMETLVTLKNRNILKEFTEEKNRLNNLPTVDYEGVNQLKWKLINKIYTIQKAETFASEGYKKYIEENKHWLIPYAVFCFIRDENKTADFNQWPSYRIYNEKDAEKLIKDNEERIYIHFFVQYHLHLQLKEATAYAHENGIILKGDIPIGVYRNGADAWQQPELYHMNMQAGAPPDAFAVKGQNWGFPTYNWQKMQDDHFSWWKKRFAQMKNYFDAFRIDHILGFFRIWSIPNHAVEGIMGHFEPALALHINEFHEKSIWFDFYRYCKPFISEEILNNTFGDQKEYVAETFLTYDGFGNYQMKHGFDTQREVENHFKNIEDNEHNRWMKGCLYDLISNVILFEAEGSNREQFHFRFGMENTLSFLHLDPHTQSQLKDLYVNYFFRRQDDFWQKQAYNKLPGLKRTTNMLVCGEDLGLVPSCVPDVMKQLGILSLEIQRMPKQTEREFFHPNDAPYLSVVTPSTHDMSTIRGWWGEDRAKTERFYNNEMGQWGNAPHDCEDWINKAIITQHLYSPAMWSIFQIQDILGSDGSLRAENPEEERINVPANPTHYWKYRMHITLEDLLSNKRFNEELLAFVRMSGRG